MNDIDIGKWVNQTLLIAAIVVCLFILPSDVDADHEKIRIDTIEYDSGSNIVSFSGFTSEKSLNFSFVDINTPIGNISVIENGYFTTQMNVGKLTPGTYTLRVFSSDGFSVHKSFIVSNRIVAESAILNKSELSLVGDSTDFLKVSLLPEDTTDTISRVSWSSSNDGLYLSVKDGLVSIVSVSKNVQTVYAEVVTNAGDTFTCSCDVITSYGSMEARPASLSLVLGSSDIITLTVPEGYSEVSWWKETGIDNVELEGNGSTAKVKAISVGQSVIKAMVANKFLATMEISISPAPVSINLYKFWIQMKYDADKVQHPHYNQSMLENGFEIEAEGTNALEAFEKACSQRNIPFYSYSNDKLKGWFNSLFGLGDVYMGDGLWKYWVQYYEGTYNQFTLGYYTNGGNFQIIYDITSEDMSGGGGGSDGDKPDPKPSITEDGEIKTETSSEKKNEDGSITRIKTETTERLDGSREEVETRVDTSADG